MINNESGTCSKKQVQGSVLFTVLVVMLVLIVFLMGTLGLATAANRRAQNAFTSSQAQYTARALVEGTVSAIRNSIELKEEVDKLKGDPSKSITLGKDDVILPEGAHYGKVRSIVIEGCDPQYSFNETTGAWDKVEVIKITATAESGTEVQTYSSYITSTQIPYSVPVTETSLVTHISYEEVTGITGSSSVGISNLTENTYTETAPATQPTGTNPGNPFDSVPAVASVGGAAGGTCAGIFGGIGMNMGVDWLRNGKSGTKDIFGYTYYDGEIKVGDNANNCYEAPFSVNGSYSITGLGARLIFPYAGAGVTIWGDLLYDNFIAVETGTETQLRATSKFNYTEVPYIYVEGSLKPTQQLNVPHPQHNPNPSIPLNIFAGDIQFTNPIVDPFAGDIYLMDEKGTSTINAKGTTILTAWTGSLVTGSTYHQEDEYSLHNLYSLGNVSLGLKDQAQIKGDVIIDGNLTIGENGGPGQWPVVNGDLVVKGTVSGAGKIIVKGSYYGTASGTVMSEGAEGKTKAPTGAYTAYSGYTVNETAYQTMSTLTDISNLTKKMSTNNRPGNVGVFPWYMQKTWILGLFPESTEQQLNAGAPTIPAAYYKDKDGKLRSRQIVRTPQDEAEEMWTSLQNLCLHDETAFIGGLAPKDLPTTGGVYVAEPGTYGVLSGTLTSSLRIDLPAGMNTYKIVIAAGTTLAPNDLNGYGTDSGSFLIFNDTTGGNWAPNKRLDIMLEGDVTFNGNAGIITEYYKNKLFDVANVDYRLGSSDATVTGNCETLAKPNVYIYANEWPYTATTPISYTGNNNYTMRFSNSKNAFMTAYLLAPGVDVDYDMTEHNPNSNVYNHRIYYNGYIVKNKEKQENCKNVAWIGAVVAGHIKMANGAGVTVLNYPMRGLYIPPQPETTTSSLLTTSVETGGQSEPNYSQESVPPVTQAVVISEIQSVVVGGGDENLQWFEEWTDGGYDGY